MIVLDLHENGFAVLDGVPGQEKFSYENGEVVVMGYWPLQNAETRIDALTPHDEACNFIKQTFKNLFEGEGE